MVAFMFSFDNGASFFVEQKDVFREVYAEVGDSLAPNGVPLAQEVEGWSELASVGDSYVADHFVVQCVE